jgi:hypothetical protein
MLSKKNKWLIIVILAINVSLFSSNVFGENLVKYAESKDGNRHYYDEKRVKRLSGKVKVWTVIRWGDEFKSEVREKFPDIGLEDLSFTKSLKEINCKEEKIRTLNSAAYAEDGTVLHTSDKPSDWTYIIPDSHADKLKRHVCK